MHVLWHDKCNPVGDAGHIRKQSSLMISLVFWMWAYHTRIDIADVVMHWAFIFQMYAWEHVMIWFPQFHTPSHGIEMKNLECSFTDWNFEWLHYCMPHLRQVKLCNSSLKTEYTRVICLIIPCLRQRIMAKNTCLIYRRHVISDVNTPLHLFGNPLLIIDSLSSKNRLVM